ncbi:MAG: hypothetical protein JSW58_08345 [Candidatus Latescibacterota bacterium]|nr:MAG: hypothetical protein JSW58_08345 [Candidatus Latescibacterota bacterium]
MAEVDTSKFSKRLSKLAKKLTDKTGVLDDMEFLADELLARAENSPVPSDTRELARSAATVRNDDRKEVVFGFNKVYAAFQDQPEKKSGTIVIKPRRKKILYIPLTSKGRRYHMYGRDPNLEGLVYGRDYILLKEVRIPIKAYGSELGPNHYFSETIKRNINFVFETLAKMIGRRLKAQEGGGNA